MKIFHIYKKIPRRFHFAIKTIPISFLAVLITYVVLEKYYKNEEHKVYQGVVYHKEGGDLVYVCAFWDPKIEFISGINVDNLQINDANNTPRIDLNGFRNKIRIYLHDTKELLELPLPDKLSLVTNDEKGNIVQGKVTNDYLKELASYNHSSLNNNWFNSIKWINGYEIIYEKDKKM